jgi:hypothetical protein
MMLSDQLIADAGSIASVLALVGSATMWLLKHATNQKKAFGRRISACLMRKAT